MAYTIEDEALLARLQAKANEYGISLERWLGVLLDSMEMLDANTQNQKQPWQDIDPQQRDLYVKMFNKARRYWAEQADAEKAGWTDEQMYQEFAFFKGGIPYLQHEAAQIPLQPGTGRFAAMIARRFPMLIETVVLNTAVNADEILEAEFAASIDQTPESSNA